MPKRKTWDAVGTLRKRRKEGQIGVGLGRFEVVGPGNRVTTLVNNGRAKCDPWVGKFVYIRGCMVNNDKVPLIEATYCGDDQITRDATPPCR